jgi:hypothetical protein
MKRLRTIAMILSIALLQLPLQAAFANRTVVDDAQGDGGIARRDIDRAIADHQDGLLLHKVVMHGSFTTGKPRICILIQTNESGYRICSQNVERTSDAAIVGHARVTRPNSKTIGFKFRKSAIGRPGSYDWHAAVGSHTIYCNTPPCDLTQTVKHRL